MNRLSQETIRLKLRDKLYVPATRVARKQTISCTDFTIISNNCWGGTVYESYDLRKNSPTVGMFIMPEDFITLVSDLKHHLALPLEFIRPDRSRWRGVLEREINWGTYPIGRIGEVELHMLHHHDETSARRKWNSRIERVNYQKLIFKLNDQNGCTEEQARRFDDLDLENKVYFTVRDNPDVACRVKIRAPGHHDYIRASYEPIGGNRSFNVNSYINSKFAPRAGQSK